MPKAICASCHAATTLSSLGCGDSQRRSACAGCCHGVCGRHCCGGASCGCCSCNPGHRCCGGSKGCCGVHSCGCSSGAGHCEVWRHLPDSHFPMSSLALPNLSPFRPLPDTRVLMSSLVLLSLFVTLSLFPPALLALRPPSPFWPARRDLPSPTAGQSLSSCSPLSRCCSGASRSGPCCSGAAAAAPWGAASCALWARLSFFRAIPLYFFSAERALAMRIWNMRG